MEGQLRSSRSFVKTFFLNIITVGIYRLVQECHISEEINLVASPHDGKKTMHYALIFFVFSWLTLCIAPIVWQHRTCNRIGDELRRRGISSEFSSKTFWGWCVLGSLIGVGPLVYLYKRLQAMNAMNQDYNAKG